MTEPFRLITQPESWKSEVQNDVVTRLRELLEMAESGELQGIAYSASTVDGCVMTGFTKSADQNGIIGGLARVQYRMIAGEE
ncbi:hypothetical protein ASG25_10645 [Rhizobium sp. Leaf384]|uniref:hypothetical protein n=1 Tax=Rhizobium sp. Leaf384 TaxID=1736358 RepID=UPI0007141C34|nr:hypothetical protein [Rhizobium sp. Leaf384]KQS79036.1 hypothetical protein ASG25_10645 [Rhizobium sp. Leaf384]